jgi:peptide/nickel transport system ATP-binding protein
MSAEQARTLACEQLCVSFTVATPAGPQTVDAVRGVSVAVQRGRVLGIVGESGSGKSTLARSLVGLQAPTSGAVRCGELDVTDRSAAVRRQLGRRVAMVFQDPRSSLNPRLSVRAVIADPLKVHRVGTRESRAELVEKLLADVGLPARVAARRVRTLSGGQLQRVAIARALALSPDFIVADEPTSALDVSVQAQILNLLAELRQEHQFGMLVISHDMRVMRFLCDDLVVMLGGEVVERGAAASIYADPQHQYTRELIGATPLLGTAAATG